MRSRFPTCRIADLGRVVTGKTPSTRIKEYFGGEYPFITIPDMDGGRRVTSTGRTLSAAGAAAVRSSLLPADAVLMSCIATVGKSGMTVCDSVTNQQINGVICNPGVSAVYVYYAFQQLGSDLQAAGGGGSVYTNVSKSRFSALEIPLPDLRTQEAVASILGALDDKIELNRKMGEKLYEAAEATFASVFSGICERADAASGSTAVLDSLVTLTKGRSYRSVELGASDTALVTLKSFARLGGYRPDGLKSYVGSFKPEQVIEPGEIVVALTDVTQAADVIGNPAIVLPNAHYQTLVASLDTAIVRPKDDAPRSFLYFLMRTRAFKRHARAHTTGTTVLHLNPQHLLAFRVGGFSKGAMGHFDGVASPMLDRIRSSVGESVTLASLRDTLLPRLLSGELRIADAEKTVEEVL
jgi:type I restriction enzyme, S subunit